MVLIDRFHCNTGRRLPMRTVTRRLLERDTILTGRHDALGCIFGAAVREQGVIMLGTHHWRHCIFTDESSRIPEMYELGCVRGKVRDTLMSVCRGQMVWTGFHYSDKSELVVLDGTMNQQVYRRVLQQSRLLWARANFQNNYFLVQHNAPPHTVRATRDFLENQDMAVMY